MAIPSLHALHMLNDRCCSISAVQQDNSMYVDTVRQLFPHTIPHASLLTSLARPISVICSPSCEIPSKIECTDIYPIAIELKFCYFYYMDNGTFAEV